MKMYLYATEYQRDNLIPRGHTHWKKYGVSSFKNLLYFLGYPQSDPLDYLDASFHYQKVEAGKVLQKQGQPCHRLFFVINGAVKMGPVMDGKETIFALLGSGNLATSFCDFLYGYPSGAKIEACRTTRVLWIHKTDYEKAIARMDPQGMANIMEHMNRHALAHLKWAQNNLFLDARKRVKALYETYPHIFHTFDDADIASHLGITRMTLNRMKREVFRAGTLPGSSPEEEDK